MKIKISKDTTLEKILSEKFQGISKSKIKQMIKYQKIMIDGRAATRLDEILTQENELELNFDKDPGVGKQFKAEFKVLWEDQYLIAGLKPAGLLTVGEGSDKNPSFFKLVQDYVKNNSKGKDHVYTIHRLDREVSGIVLFAKSESIQKTIKDHWKENTKLYYALVEGKPKEAQGRIESFLTEDPKTLLVRSTTKLEDDQCKHAVTHYKTVQQQGPYTLLEVKLETGRKNQIRVHLSELGHPIVGDRRYGADAKFERQIRLLAFFLKFEHPVTKKWIEISIPMPANFLHILNKDERYK